LFTSGLAIEVDATGAFRDERRPVYQEDGVHYTGLGNRLVADSLQSAVSAGACTA
jgi:hypothetical protein